MSFQGTDQAYRLFQRRDFDRPTAIPFRSSELLAKSGKTPGFLVRGESALGGCFASIKALCTRTKLPAATRHLRHLYRDASLTGFRAPGVGVATSILLHIVFILDILIFPMVISPSAPRLSAAFSPPEVVFYPVPEHHAPARLPRIAPRGPGGRPGSGVHLTLPPEPGKTTSNGDLTVISKPVHADNSHQTIIQPAAPPDLRIPRDVPLPNLALGTVAQPKKPILDLSMQKPSQENAKLAADMAAPSAENKADNSISTMLQPTNSNPKLAIPVSSIARPIRPDARLAADMGAPSAQMNVNSSLGTTLQGTNSQPKVPLSGGFLSKPVRRDAGGDGTSGPDAPEIAVSGDNRAILAIGVAPSGLTSGLAVPPGNRWADFTIAPGTGTSGSPGGKPGGAPGGGGSGGNGRAGDPSVGIGPGHEGGGGGKDGAAGSISVKGTGNAVAGVTTLDPRIEAKMVYPVGTIASRLRKSQMIISAGPIGGGGLSVYGALPCPKIYTIFLPMNDVNWTMQYCQKATPSADGSNGSEQSTVIRLETGLIPPDPEMESRFDFKRLPAPPGKGQQMIVLKGTLKEDGTVDGLEVYQGIVPQMDEAALLAFSRWKFKPAMKGGRPVAIELLVGIPPEIPPAGISQ